MHQLLDDVPQQGHQYDSRGAYIALASIRLQQAPVETKRQLVVNIGATFGRVVGFAPRHGLVCALTVDLVTGRSSSLYFDVDSDLAAEIKAILQF